MSEYALVNEHDNNAARGTMLARIREHLAASAPFDAVHKAGHAGYQAKAVNGAPVELGTPVERFREALEAVKGQCIVVEDETSAANALAQIIARSGLSRVAVSDSPLFRRLTDRIANGIEFVSGATPAELFDCDAGITSAQWAIAETGTLVLESEQERNRLASLIPPVHIAVLEASQIRQTMAEALEAISRSGLSRAVTFITGPSRTSDIELTLAIGVHGPGELHVIVINT